MLEIKLKPNCKKNAGITLQQRGLTCRFHVNLDFLVSDEYGNVLDEEVEEVISIWGNLVHLRAQMEEQVVFRRHHGVMFTHLETKSHFVASF